MKDESRAGTRALMSLSVVQRTALALAWVALALEGADSARGADFDQERLFARSMDSYHSGVMLLPPEGCLDRLPDGTCGTLGRAPLAGLGDRGEGGCACGETGSGGGPWTAWATGWSAPPAIGPVDGLPGLLERGGAWGWQVLPPGLMYKSYLAGVREPRFSTAMLYERRRGWVWDSTLGGRVGVLRHGSYGAVRPQGFQLDMEGAAIVRLDPENQDDLEGVDFRFGVPFTWREGPLAVKFGYYHISSHVGDEFLLRNADHHRLNYVRDALIFGVSLDLTPNTRTYAETAWAFKASDGARPWEFQFGSEYSPARAQGVRPVPYAAINGHLRQEHNFGGDLSLMAGWQWRGELTDRLWRFGFQYYNGKSIQYSFFDRNEQLTGLGLWFDY